MIAPVEVAGEGVVLRPYGPRDASLALAAIRESMDSVGRWMPWCHADYDAHDSAAWIDKCQASWRRGDAYEFAIFDGAQRYVGGVGLNQIDHVNNRSNLGYWIRASRQGQGFAPAAARCAVAFGFETVRLTRIEIVAACDNFASCRVAEKLGALREGMARNRLVLAGKPVAAFVYSLVPR
jgi:RimJ/RimL family protein N-acetyltransferase